MTRLEEAAGTVAWLRRRAVSSSRVRALTDVLTRLSRVSKDPTDTAHDGEFTVAAGVIADSIVSVDVAALDLAFGDLQMLHATFDQHSAHKAGRVLDSGFGHEDVLSSSTPHVHCPSCYVQGRIHGLLDIADAARSSASVGPAMTTIGQGSIAERMLLAIYVNPEIRNKTIADKIGAGEDSVSRVGRDIEEDGLAFGRRRGREKRWEVTPKGRDFIARRIVEYIQSHELSEVAPLGVLPRSGWSSQRPRVRDEANSLNDEHVFEIKDDVRLRPPEMNLRSLDAGEQLVAEAKRGERNAGELTAESVNNLAKA